MPDVSCANCTYYRAPQAVPAGSPVQLRGACQRYPASVIKLPTEVCGEHPKLAAVRHMSMAGLIAENIQRVANEARVLSDGEIAEALRTPVPTKKTLFRR